VTENSKRAHLTVKDDIEIKALVFCTHLKGDDQP